VLEMMGLGDTIAPPTDEHVAIAARLGCDKPWRMAVKTRISSNEDLIYRDRVPISAREGFLNRAA
jgi:hypothetical protein